MDNTVIDKNMQYWDDHADLWFGTTALPDYGVRFVTENNIHFFNDVNGKKVLEICCGSGHSLKYLADRGAAELWGLDLSHKQIDNATTYLRENGYSANLICAPMESDADIPTDYFDYVYSIYGIGWTTDLQGTFNKIASYLKKVDTSFSVGIIPCISALQSQSKAARMLSKMGFWNSLAAILTSHISLFLYMAVM